MRCNPITEAEIWGTMNESYDSMTLEQRRVWEVIRINPQKWSQEPYGNQGGGFWVVAIIGNTVIWFNDIEDGFNCSTYSNLGKINEYFCNQDRLEWQIQNVINEMREGFDSAGYCGAPEPIA